jgi:2-pyrone-4,6-dicarboxylate lactonase
LATAPQPYPHSRKPSTPVFRLPQGTVDTHCHIFAPVDRFPYAPGMEDERVVDAPKEELWRVRDHLGIARNVIVQAHVYNDDNTVMVDAMADGRARGIGMIDPAISDRQLQALHSAGMRGVRFPFVKHLPGLPRDVITAIVERVAPLGWHTLVYVPATDLPELYDFIAALPTVVVLDHMGRPDLAKPIDGPEFGLVLTLIRENTNVWCKVSAPDRLSLTGPDAYEDVVPYARRIIDEFPDRVIWGTDWPHPNSFSHCPDDGKLVDFIPRVATTPELQRKLLVDNPMRLYWPEEVP